MVKKKSVKKAVKKPTKTRAKATAGAKSQTSRAAIDAALIDIAKNGRKATHELAKRAIDAQDEVDRRLGFPDSAGQRDVSPMLMEPFGGSNFVGTLIERKRVKGVPQDELAIIVLVRRKNENTKNLGKSLIDKNINGFSTDVVEVGAPESQVAKCGTGVKGPRMWGSLSCVVEFDDSPDKYLLGNWHVLIYGTNQPGHQVIDENRNPIAVGESWISPWPDRQFNLDLGLARVTTSDFDYSNCLVKGPPLTAAEIDHFRDNRIQVPVQGYGKDMRHRTGWIHKQGFDVSVKVSTGTDRGKCRFTRQLEIFPGFTSAGDSGVLIVTRDGRPIGLHHAGSTNAVYASRIDDVITATGIDKIHGIAVGY